MTEALLLVSLACLIAFGALVAINHNRRLAEWRRAMEAWKAQQKT